MSRLQKKCIIASATLHALLLALLFVSPAFMHSEEKVVTIPVITLIPGKLIDEKMIGGGNPQATTPPQRTEAAPPSPPATQVVQKPPEPAGPEPKITQQAKVEPAPKPVRTPKKPDAEPTPIKPKVKPQNEPPPKSNPADSVATDKPAKKKPKIEPTFDGPSEAERERAQSKARAETQAKERALRAQYAKKINELGENLSKNLSTGTSIEPPGPGGEAYLYYGWAIVKYFEEAWFPNDVADSDATVKATVTIRRDGTVLSRQITKRSGDSLLDKSVQRALDSVKKVPAFPEGAKEDQRTFKLNFNLKAKRLSG